MEITKLNLIGMSNNERMIRFDFDKKELLLFYELFPSFLNDFKLEVPILFDSTIHENKAYSTMLFVNNTFHDIEIVFLEKNIVVVVRGLPDTFNTVKEKIFKIARWKNG